MDNHEIAQIFRDLALILEFQGENPFKVNAYRNAHKIIDSLERPIEDLLREDVKLKGIGPIIKEKLKEILTTGELKKHKELVGSVPGSIISLLRELDLLPRILRKLHDELGVNDWESLRSAYFSGKLREIGIGASTIKKIESALKARGLI